MGAGVGADMGQGGGRGRGGTERTNYPNNRRF